MLDFIGRVCILSAMPRRVLLALAGCVLFGALGWGPAPPGTSRSGRPPLRSLIADSRLLALERDNGCLDLRRRRRRRRGPTGPPRTSPAATCRRPGWYPIPIRRSTASPSMRIERSRLRERSQPSRALVVRPARGVDRAAKRSTPLTGIRGPATGMMFIAAVTVDPEAQEIYTVDNDIGDRMMVFPYDAERQRQAEARAERAAPGVGRVDQPGAQGNRRQRRRATRDRRLRAGRQRVGCAAPHDSRAARPGSATRTACSSTAGTTR